MKKTIHLFSVCLLSVMILFCFTAMSPAPGGGKETPKDARCPVCGMFVAKYPTWIVVVHHQSGKEGYFDGVKDMMAYYFDPVRFGAGTEDPIQEIKVKDYYTLNWLDGEKAFFVAGSDVYGPMGHEFIPFSTQEAAENFLKDHHGTQVLSFADITIALTESLRSGQKMK